MADFSGRFFASTRILQHCLLLLQHLEVHAKFSAHNCVSVSESKNYASVSESKNRVPVSESKNCVPVSESKNRLCTNNHDTTALSRDLHSYNHDTV